MAKKEEGKDTIYVAYCKSHQTPKNRTKGIGHTAKEAIADLNSTPTSWTVGANHLIVVRKLVVK